MTVLLDRLVAVEIEGDAPAAAARERQVAVRDLLEENRFALPPREGRDARGPYRLRLGLRDRRLVFAVESAGGEAAAEFHLSLGPFRQVVKDYVQILQSHDEAVTGASPARVEAIDMARRGIHDEGARVLQERLDGKASFDRATARRLFTLICALHPDGPSSGGPGSGGPGAGGPGA